MNSCERQGGINKGRMDRWLALSPDHNPLFSSLTLKPNSEGRLQQALYQLGTASDVTNSHGRRSLKNVLQCFEPVSAIHTPPNDHTGGATLYGQVAAAFDAYRTGKLDPGAMETVERFTELVLFAIAGNTQEPDQDISSLTYEQELFSGKVNKTLYTTDSLGEHALRTLDHVRTLMGEHRDTLTAKNNRISRQRIGIPLPAKVVGALTAIELILTGCVGHISPTISPTTEATRPALTAPLPTAEHTKTPTLTPTPTEAPTPTAIAEPDRSSNYPGAVSDRLLTDTTLQEHKTAFATLMKSNSDVASEARIMESRLKLICSNTCTTEGVLDQARWGIIARNSEGAPLVLQKTTDGGKTWVNVVDASAYSELVANSKFDKTNYRLTPLQWPSGIPADATGEVVTQNNWMVYVWRSKATGNILAWYDAAHDQYLTVDGEKLELTKTYTYKPLSEMTTWEDCVAPEQQLPWIEDPEFENAWNAFLQATTPSEPPKQYDYGGLNIGTVMMLSNEQRTSPITYKYNWESSSLNIPIFDLAKTTGGQALACGTIKTPDGTTLQLIRFPIRVVPDTKVAEFGTAYVYITLAVDEALLKKNYVVSPGIQDVPSLQPIQVQFSAAKSWASIDFIPYSKTQPITQTELTDPLTKHTAALIQKNQKNGVHDALRRMLTYEITKEDIDLLNQSIFPVKYFIISGKSTK